VAANPGGIREDNGRTARKQKSGIKTGIFSASQFHYLYPMKVYGIPNCDTVKKALGWLKANHVDYEFHDFKKLGISAEKLKEWDKKAGYEKFLNKKSTTWKDVGPEVQESIKTGKAALKLLQEKTSMIKRPVIEDSGFLFFGFDEKVYKEQLVR
jgi:Spx/MgsR family transcriptional regulator